MMFLIGALLVFGIGIWIGVGAPGWPYKPDGRTRLQRRPINPVGWGKTPGRERQRPKSRDERKPRLKRD